MLVKGALMYGMRMVGHYCLIWNDCQIDPPKLIILNVMNSHSMYASVYDNLTKWYHIFSQLQNFNKAFVTYVARNYRYQMHMDISSIHEIQYANICFLLGFDGWMMIDSIAWTVPLCWFPAGICVCFRRENITRGIWVRACLMRKAPGGVDCICYTNC